MSSGSTEKRRVQFRAPERLVKRTDALAAVLETDRTDVILSALRDHLRNAAHDDEIKQEIAGAYYDGEISFEELRELLGHEEAANFRVLKQQLNEEFIEDLGEELSE